MVSEPGEPARATTAIYTLSDPRDRRVRYVGKTEKPMGTRLSQHIYASRHNSHHLANWMKLLLNENLMPIAEIVEVVPVGGDWVGAEQKWIAHFREQEAKLTNSGDGGEGNPGFTHRADTRKRLSLTTSEYMNQPEVKRKHALGMSRFDEEDIETILRRVVDGETQQAIADDIGVTQNYISRIVTGATFGWMEEHNELRQAAKEATFRNSHKLTEQVARQIVEG